MMPALLTLIIKDGTATWLAYDAAGKQTSGQTTLQFNTLEDVQAFGIGCWLGTLLGLDGSGLHVPSEAKPNTGLHEITEAGTPIHQPYDLAERGLQAELDAKLLRVWLRDPNNTERKLVLRDSDSSTANFTDLLAPTFAPLDDAQRRLAFASIVQLLADICGLKIHRCTNDGLNYIIR